MVSGTTPGFGALKQDDQKNLQDQRATRIIDFPLLLLAVRIPTWA